MNTKIEYIGHHGASLTDFCDMLRNEPLEPEWGECVQLTSEAEWVRDTPPEASEYKYLVSGNFYKTSCAFRFWSNDESLIQLIQANESSKDYREVVEIRETQKQERKARFLAKLAADQAEREAGARRTLGI